MYLYRIRYLNDFLKTHSRLHSNYSGKREAVDSPDHVPQHSCWLGCVCHVRDLQRCSSRAWLQMHLHKQICTWAGRPYFPGWRRKAGQGASWNKALLLLKAAFTHNAANTCSHSKYSSKPCLL